MESHSFHKALLMSQIRNLSYPMSKSEPDNARLIKILLKELHPKLQRLWDAYNSQDKDLRRDRRISERDMALCYLLGFQPNQLARTQHIMARIETESGLFSKMSAQSQSVQILDLGCGAGAWAATLVHFLTPQKTTVHLVDASRYLLDAATNGIEQQWSHPKEKVAGVRRLHAELKDARTKAVAKKVLADCQSAGSFLAIGLSYVWNEIIDKRTKFELLDLLEGLISQDQVPVMFYLSEPGREVEAREAMDFRNWLVHLGVQIVYPCPASLECPMSNSQGGEQSRDWCFSEVPATTLKEFEPVNQFLGLKRERLAVATFCGLNKKAQSMLFAGDQAQRNSSTQYRIVGFPLESEHQQTLVCDGVSLFKRKIFAERMMRGDLFVNEKRV